MTVLKWFLRPVCLKMTDFGDIGPNCDSTMESLIYRWNKVFGKL